MTNANVNVLKKLCFTLSQREPYRIPSPSDQPRRGVVAAILRWHCPKKKIPREFQKPRTLEEFFDRSWVQEGEAEILFMQRATRKGDRWSGHVAFPGGKNEKDETDEETVCREVREEIGVDLKSDDYLLVGQLDEREISSIRDNKLLMILVPYVYLQIVPESPPFELQTSEVAAVRWVPLSFFLSSQVLDYTPITEPLSIFRHMKRRWLKSLLNVMLGTISFTSIDLPPTTASDNVFRLWGLTMGMTKDIIKLVDTKESFFYKLTTQSPRFSRVDIGWFTMLITYAKVYWKRICHKNVRLENEWDNIYWNSIRSAIAISMCFRACLLLLIIKRLH
ncbi:unnamed protein product [Rhizopus microsporus]